MHIFLLTFVNCSYLKNKFMDGRDTKIILKFWLTLCFILTCTFILVWWWQFLLIKYEQLHQRSSWKIQVSIGKENNKCIYLLTCGYYYVSPHFCGETYCFCPVHPSVCHTVCQHNSSETTEQNFMKLGTCR